MENLIGKISSVIFVILEIVIIFGIGIRLAQICFFKEKHENAIVFDKQCYDKQIYSKFQAPYVKKEFVVTFECKNKRLHFSVNEISYNNYKKGQKGILKYKGNRLIEFK